MNAFSFRPARRLNTPLIIGLAGPTKSGKTYSAHRIAVGLAKGGAVAMINAEGAKGHQYSDKFTYLACDITAPYRPERYTEALKTALALNPRPAVVIIDSLSHMHDGPGGILEYHEDELDRIAGEDIKARQRATYTAWVKPKAAENEFIYTMLSADCHIIACFRAKEKIKVVKGKPPIELGWQPIAGERVAFETIFTLTLPPHCKGVPDLSISEMREPFDSMIPGNRALDEATGTKIAEWAAGGEKREAAPVVVRDPDSLAEALSVAELKENLRHAGFETSAVAEVGRKLFPGRSAGSLTDLERGDLWLAMQAEAASWADFENDDDPVADAETEPEVEATLDAVPEVEVPAEPEESPFKIPEGVQA